MDGKPLHWEQLEKDFKNGRAIVLFLGTGINYGSHNIDFSWNALINHLFQYVINQITRKGEERTAELLMNSANNLIKDSSYSWEKVKVDKQGDKYNALIKQIDIDSFFSRNVKTSIVKQKLGNEVYVSLIRDFLYNQVSREQIKKSACNFVYNLNHKESANEKKQVEFFSLLSVADLILRNRNIRAVVTQNYDRFLCDALKELGNQAEYKPKLSNGESARRDINPTTICDWKGQSAFTYDEINIYHVHGFVPRYDEIQAPKDNKIVLSMDEFYEDTKNVYSWQIASQLHFLSQYTCIFCGLSLDDYTNQRLLHYVKNKHHGNLYYLTAGNERSRIYDRIINEYHERNGLTVLYDENGYTHLYELLNKLQYEYNK